MITSDVMLARPSMFLHDINRSRIPNSQSWVIKPIRFGWKLLNKLLGWGQQWSYRNHCWTVRIPQPLCKCQHYKCAVMLISAIIPWSSYFKFLCVFYREILSAGRQHHVVLLVDSVGHFECCRYWERKNEVRFRLYVNVILRGDPKSVDRSGSDYFI